MVKYKSKQYREFVFTHNFFRYLLMDRVLLEKDNVILVTGARGQGKTTFALKIILGFEDFDKAGEAFGNEWKRSPLNEGETAPKLEGFQRFKLEEHMVFQQKQFHDQCQNLRKGFILADEAVVQAGRRNSMTKANKILHRIITINRKNFNSIFFCLPSIEDFDLSILQYITCWVHIDDRGLGAIMLPNPPSIFGRKSWDVDRMKKTYEKFFEDNPLSTQIPYWLFENFRGYVKFHKLPKYVEEEYSRIAHEKKNAELEEEQKQENAKKPRFSDEEQGTMKALVEELLAGKIDDPVDYYKYCQTLGFTKERLNKVISEKLALEGDGRTATQIIRETRHSNDEKERDSQKVKRIVY